MDVTLIPLDRRGWILQPLREAGLSEDQTQQLLLRLAFQAIVCEGPEGAAALANLVNDQPAVVRAAWLTMIGRMLTEPTDN